MNNEPMLEVVVLTLASERYAIESVYVREVHPVRDLTPLPCTPPFLAGVMNVRGDILAVYDLGILFGLAEPPVESLNQVIVVAMPCGFSANAGLMRLFPIQKD